MATMPRPIRLQRGTFERLAEDAARHHEDIDSAAERILRDHLPATGHDRASALATLGRIETLRARMKLGDGKRVPLDYASARAVALNAHLLALGDPKRAAQMVAEAERAKREQITA